MDEHDHTFIVLGGGLFAGGRVERPDLFTGDDITPEISMLISALFWSHALMQVPAGMITDRFFVKY